MAKPAHKRVGFQHQERDLECLRGISTAGFMTIRHVGDIYFDGHHEYAKKRLQQFKAHNLVISHKISPGHPHLVAISKEGRSLLKHHHSLPAVEKPRRGSSTHDLQVLDVKSAFFRSARLHHRFSVEHFTVGPRECEFTTRDRIGYREVREADARLSLSNESTTIDCFLEVDRSTESLGVLVKKVAAYSEYFRSGGFAKTKGAKSSEFARHPFLVLFVLQNAERRNNVAEALLDRYPAVHSQVWLATLKDVLQDASGKIWLHADGYKAIVHNTQYARRGAYRVAGPRGHIARDRYVHEHLNKVALGFGFN